MAKMIFVNLPVADVARSTAFYEAIGGKKDARFSQEGVAASVALSDTIVLMLLCHERFRDFSPRPIADARTSVQVLMSLSEDSREAVDVTVQKAIAAGGKGDPSPVDDYGFMYGRGFEDLDGHVFGVMWMDVNAAMAAKSGGATTAA